MKRQKLIALKAFFLLIVFCMRTMVSFACAMGLEMGYNKDHHQEVSAEAPSSHKHEHSGNAKHEHTKTVKHQHSKTESSDSKSKTDDCCKKEAKKFACFDKIVAKTSVDVQQPVFFISFIQTFHSLDLLASTQLTSFRRNLYRNHHPPIPDTRIAIQSFLI